MIKKIFTTVLSLTLIVSLFSVYAFAETSVSWYVRKNGNKRPIFGEDLNYVDNYNGYYIDKKVSDRDSKKIIYLTFDAGYENGNVEKILNTLKEKSVPAAFFLLDNIILKNTDLVIRMANEGHTVCNHTKNHKDLTKCSFDEIRKNLSDLEKIYEQKTGKIMSKYFRFPEGRFNEATLKYINDLGYKTVFWSFGYEDWDNNRQPSCEKAIQKIIANTHNGEVILLHPTSSTNAEILPRLIDLWIDMGYSFGTLDQLTQ